MEIFMRVVANGSLSAAGREVGLSPAAVSKRLRRLEETLGARLLERTTRQLALTEAGQAFHARIGPLLAGIEEAENLVTERSADMRGTLKVSAPTSFGRMLIAPHMQGFMAAHPQLSINLQLSDEFVDIVGEGFDLAIRIGEMRDSSLMCRKLGPVRRVLCASPGYLDRHGTPKDLSDLGRHICLPPHNNDSWNLEGPDGTISYRPSGPLRSNSSEVIREAVLGGAGIALRSTWDVGAELNDGRLVRVLNAYEGRRGLGIYALYPSREFMPAKVRSFIDFLHALYAPLFGTDAQTG
nr:LysR family transcriptional regulator [Pseudohoeflea sp. DP4N28-3]